MALGSALVDRARLIRYEPTAVKVMGTTQHGWVEGAWFRCRLQLPQQPETAEPSRGKDRVEMRPVLLYARRDTQGEPVVLTSETQVEVVSKEQGGTFVFMPDADPEPLRRKRTVIGFQVVLKRVEEHEREVEPA